MPIRLTDERWGHIVENRDAMTGYLEDCLAVIERPDLVLRGHSEGHCVATVRTKRVKGPSRKKAISGAMTLARLVRELPAAEFYLDFDEEADVLYISFKRPQQATETVELDGGGILLDYRNKELVGISVLAASTR